MTLLQKSQSSLLLLVLLAACGGSVEGGGSTGAGGDSNTSSSSSGSTSASSSGSGGGSASSSSSGSTSSGAGGGSYCYSPAAPIPFSRACAAPSDCALKLHMIDCCGSLAAVGINTSDAPAFDAAEMSCFAICDCLSKPTIADDGKTSNDNAAFAVSCVAGQCRTSVP